MLKSEVFQTAYMLAAVVMACLGQLILRSRPTTIGIRGLIVFLALALICYGASFGITAMVLPSMNRKLAVVTLSTQYPLLYMLFSLKDSATISPKSMIAISVGYALVAVGMFGK